MKNIFFLVTAAAVFFVISGFKFSPEDPAGKKIFVDNKCTTCHSVDSEGITSKAKKKNDLSEVGSMYKADKLQKFLTKKEEINDKKHGFMFKGSDDELKQLASWLESLKKK